MCRSDRVESFKSQNRILTSGFGEERNETPVNSIANRYSIPPHVISNSQVSSSLFRELIKRNDYNLAYSILAETLTDEQKMYIVDKASEIQQNIALIIMKKVKEKEKKTKKKNMIKKKKKPKKTLKPQKPQKKKINTRRKK